MRPIALPLLASCLACGLLFADEKPKAKGPLKVLVACTKGQLTHYEQWLEKNYNVKSVWAGDGSEKKKGEKKEDKKIKDTVGLEKAHECDTMLLNLYRVTPNEKQLAEAKKYFASGKGVVGLRKASHAFQNWQAIDKEVFGAKYGGHYFDDRNNQIMTVEEKGKKCKVIGDFKPFMPGGGLYKYTELASEVEVMISGGPDGKMMPQVWCRHHPKTKAHIFYARYDPDDLKKDEGCRQMIARALFWSAGREVEKK